MKSCSAENRSPLWNLWRNTIIQLNNKNNTFSDCVWWSQMLVMNSTWNGICWCWMSSFTFRQTVRQPWISTWTLDWKWLIHKGIDPRQKHLRSLLTKTCQKFKSISTYAKGNNAFFKSQTKPEQRTVYCTMPWAMSCRSVCIVCPLL